MGSSTPLSGPTDMSSYEGACVGRVIVTLQYGALHGKSDSLTFNGLDCMGLLRTSTSNACRKDSYISDLVIVVVTLMLRLDDDDVDVLGESDVSKGSRTTDGSSPA